MSEGGIDGPSTAAAKGDTLERILDALEILEEARTTSGVTVEEETEYDRQREVRRGYRATNRVVVRLGDPGPLGELIRRATEETGARVEGPWWRVLEDNPAWIEACRSAALMAKEKAAAYAGALGLGLGALISAVDARHDRRTRQPE